MLISYYKRNHAKLKGLLQCLSRTLFFQKRPWFSQVRLECPQAEYERALMYFPFFFLFCIHVGLATTSKKRKLNFLDFKYMDKKAIWLPYSEA